MAKSGPIIIVEDDIDDKEILQEVLKILNVDNQLIWFTSALMALEHLKKQIEPPFIIFSDINLPALNGIEFKKRIDEDPVLRRKSIPFVFYSTSINHQAVEEAYTEMTVQGFFKKGNSFEEMKKQIRIILDYWNECQHPNSL